MPVSLVSSALRSLALALLLSVYAAVILVAPCEAQGPTAEELDAALVLARYSANEAGFRDPADLLLIWQIAEGHAETLAGRVRWLRRHSRCVVALEVPEEWPPGNCRWARFLDRSGRAPTNWTAGLRAWRRIRPLWEAQLELSLRVVRGEEEARPCDGNPQTWDGWRWADRRGAEGFALVPCRNPWTGARLRNAAFRFPPPRRPARPVVRRPPPPPVAPAPRRPAERPEPPVGLATAATISGRVGGRRGPVSIINAAMGESLH